MPTDRNLPIGICGLCKQTRELQKSHLLPKAVYSIIGRAGSNDCPGQIGFLNADNSFCKLKHQVTKYYLCDDCESILDKRGENVVIRELYSDTSGAGKFILRDKLDSIQGEFSNDHSCEWFFQDNLGTIDVKAYIHFTLGVLWRASSTDWNNKSFPDCYKNALGTKYEEQIRQYLITQEHRFLSKIQITVFVDTSRQPISWVEMPCYHKRDGMNVHEFALPGIYVYTTVGGKKFYNNGSPMAQEDQHLLFAKLNLQTGKRFEAIVSRFQNSTRSS